MTYTEWIVSVDDDCKDSEEMFIGNVRDGDRLVRCCDCIHWMYWQDDISQMTHCSVHRRASDPMDYCSWAEKAYDND